MNMFSMYLFTYCFLPSETLLQKGRSVDVTVVMFLYLPPHYLKINLYVIYHNQ